MKRARVATLKLGLAMALLSAGSLHAAELRYGSSQPAVNAVYKNAVTPFIERVEEQSDLSIRAYPGGQLASAKGALDSLRDGTADASLLIPLWTPSELPYINGLMQVLFTGDDPMVVTAAIAETVLLHCPPCREEMLENGAISLAPYSTSPYYLQCNKAIGSSDDLKGTRARVVGGGQTRLLEELGATRVIVTAPEIAEALTRNRIDCAVAPLSWLQSYSLGDGVKTIVDQPIGTARGMEAFAVRKESWDRLSDAEQQAVVKNLPALLADIIARGFAEEDRAAIAFAKDHGISFVEPDATFTTAVDTVRQNEREIVMAEAQRRGLHDFESILDSHIASVEKWQALRDEIGDDTERFNATLWDEIYSKIDLD
ncbi:C4-dicarboxylate TRAP transporter substrate-binding protein [Acuticoccus mangrovi]|uniref:C4-dicarboxylate TRAP transporter substrate-binding protein n=1 Tax=Acuticoccus mangrovi TaxID=2796142 RepID=A0A934IK96_9HYPH|nr:C4-dicarboxylate TRAP transporter substrate-binding protein [Acuticoccus mangrovi]MBJ3775337.1 C4-dicarboxylate TRAP transporter substrate-binding protein [Acuticoccus mangrovi]